jgi:Alpha-glutamyl/putrescinyl thymine pyrophosphorylase clade 3
MSQMHRFNCQTACPTWPPAENSITCLGTPVSYNSHLRATTIGDLLNRFLVNQTMPGLQAEQSQKRFIQCLLESWERPSIEVELSTQKINGQALPNGLSFNPRLGIIENYQKGKLDESIWLAFINIHFGLESDAIRAFYGKFGEGRWDWNSVANNPDRIRVYCQMNRERIRTLKFGNHRKFESNDPDKSVGIPNVIRSFVTWVNGKGRWQPVQSLLISYFTGKQLRGRF